MRRARLPKKFARFAVCVASAALLLSVGAPVAPGAVTGGADLVVISADGTAFRLLTYGPAHDWRPQWSPDGSKIAFTRGSEIYVVNADGTSEVNVTNNPAWDFAPDWSPDGTRLAFARELPTGEPGGFGPADVWVMNADGSGQTNLTNNPAFDSDPSWSPDGSLIAFDTERGAVLDLYVMSPDGTNQRPLAQAPLNGWAPAWSPDGAKLAFSKENGPPFWDRDIAVVDADGSNERRLTGDGRHLDSSPSWSPDGTRIVFARMWPGWIWVVNADGTGLHNLTSGSFYQDDPDWSPDGEHIVFTLPSPDPAVPPPPPPPGMPPPPPQPNPPGPPPPPPAAPAAKCRVPRVIGMKLSRARTRIRRARCSVGRIRRTRSRRVGRVIAQRPRAGTIKPRGFRLRLTVGRR